MKLKYTASKRMASANATGKSNGDYSNAKKNYPYLAICIRNNGVQASLELGKAYRIIKPLPNDPHGHIRVIDDEGEDYLYRANWFVPIEVSPAAKKSVLKAVSA